MKNKQRLITNAVEYKIQRRALQIDGMKDFCEICGYDQDLLLSDDKHTRCFSCEYEKQQREEKIK
jgi:hypothetical protein